MGSTPARYNMWVEFAVGSGLAPRVFSVFPVFLPPQFAEDRGAT